MYVFPVRGLLWYNIKCLRTIYGSISYVCISPCSGRVIDKLINVFRNVPLFFIGRNKINTLDLQTNLDG